MRWGVEEVKLYKRKSCKWDLKETEWKDVTATGMTSSLSNLHLKSCQIGLQQRKLFITRLYSLR